jgi:hypothetical protein
MTTAAQSCTSISAVPAVSASKLNFENLVRLYVYFDVTAHLAFRDECQWEPALPCVAAPDDSSRYDEGKLA